MDYDSFALASPSVTRAPLWKLAEENSSGSQIRPQAQTTNVQAQPITSILEKPSGSQTQPQAPAQALPQAAAQAQPQALAQAQPPWLAQATYLSHRPMSPCWLDGNFQTLFMMRISSLWILHRAKRL